MVRNFYEQVSEALIANNVGKIKDCLCNLIFDFKEVLTIFINNINNIINQNITNEFRYVDNVVEDVLPASYTQFFH